MPIHMCKPRVCSVCGSVMMERAKIEHDMFIPYMICDTCGAEDYSDHNEIVRKHMAGDPHE